MENRLKKESLVIEDSNFHRHLRDTFQIGSSRSPFSNTNNRISVSNSRNKQNVNQSKLVRFELKSVLTGQKSPEQKRNMQIILQAIQIQRLTQQINTGRIRSKENQNKFFSYEKQLLQLRQYCQKMLEQNNQYHVQLQKMNKISERMHQENEQLKSKLKNEQKERKCQQQSNRYSKKYQNQKIKNMKITSQQRNYESLQKENNFLKALLASTQQKLRNEQEKYVSQSIKLNQISQHELMIQGLNKQLSFSMQDNEKLHKLLKQRTSEINKWQKVARQSQNNISLKNLQKNQLIEQVKQDKNLHLSEQVLRLSQILFEKNEQLKKWEVYFNQFKLKCLQIVEKMGTSNQKENSSYLKALQKQLNQIKFQHSKCCENYKLKNDELSKLKANYMILNNDLSEINELRSVCQKQQNRIAQNLKRMELLKACNQEYENKISMERSKNNEIRSSITQKNLNKQNQLQISRILCKVTELQSTISYLNKNYQNLLARALKQR